MTGPAFLNFSYPLLVLPVRSFQVGLTMVAELVVARMSFVVRCMCTITRRLPKDSVRLFVAQLPFGYLISQLLSACNQG